MTERATYAEVARALGRRAADLAHHHLGGPTSRTSRQWRYRTKGSLVITIAGAEAGHFFDHDPPAGGRRHGDALDLIAHVTGVSSREAYAHALEFLGGQVRVEGAPRRSVDNPAPRERIEAALGIWSEAKPIGSTPAEIYLRARGITCDLPDALRFHPSCANSEAKRPMPAMIALMRDIATNEACGIHRTYLAPDGSSKANLNTAKKMLGRAKSAAIKLCPDAEVTHGLGLAEGIETGLSLVSIGWRAMWATLSAGQMAAFPVLAGIHCLTIFVDRDAAGEIAARKCCDRWLDARREVIIRRPRGATGVDWNDALIRRAAT